MDIKTADDERLNFSDRLKTALIACHQPTSPSKFARAFNLRADGATVTIHGARKWLLGEAIPTQEKIHVLALWLNLNPAWLRYGDADNGRYLIEHAQAPELSVEQLMLIHDVMSLPPAAQLIVRDLVDSFMRHDGMQMQIPAPRPRLSRS
ncbi:MAG: hypothetical protein V4484_09480 [Pseudomonadota bacterium]